MFVVGTLLTTLLVLIGLLKMNVFSSGLVSEHVSVSSTAIDFGDIPQKEGIVYQEVTVMNAGNAPLEIHRISTSCGCTTASMDSSPINAGEKRVLTITFDPMVHPDQSGPITRVVYLQTSDPEQPEIEINIKGNVIPSE